MTGLVEKIKSMGEFKVSVYGLDLRVKPSELFKELIHPEAQLELDKALESAYKTALDDFISSEENTKEEREKLNERTVFSETIKRIAHLERLIYFLHTDIECMDLNNQQKETKEFCFYVWRYAREYGFVESEKTEF